MRLRVVAMTMLGSLLFGCAGAKWVAPDAGPMPGSIQVRMGVPKCYLPDYLHPRLPTDTTAMRDWMKPRIEVGLKKATKVDTVSWNDAIDVVTDSEEIDGKKYQIDRPSSLSGSGWLMTMSSCLYGKEYQTDLRTLPALYISCNYAVFDRQKGTIVAKGKAYSRHPYFGLDSTAWARAVTEFGSEIGSKLPHR